MEKVVITSSSLGYLGYGAEHDVNKYLDQGYTVKNITTIQENGNITAIFVLEK